jgi:hypothetical protein
MLSFTIGEFSFRTNQFLECENVHSLSMKCCGFRALCAPEGQAMLWYDHLYSVTDFGQNVHDAYQQMSNLRSSKVVAAVRQCFLQELVSRRYSHSRTMQRITMYCEQSRPRLRPSIPLCRGANTPFHGEKRTSSHDDLDQEAVTTAPHCSQPTD